ncbi:MAG TPA: glycosyltransferase family 39 protein, partial [Acetobacteraceae bacterium]|nr:glycosyltransferase family 39 protein [Acetobacteraceae bacterium]
LDVIEQLAWGREWQIVYFKHPPLPAWIVESVAVATGRWPPAQYLVGPLCSALALIAIWRLGCRLLGQQRALLAVLAQEGVLYFTFFTPEFNHNVVLLPLWAWLGLAAHGAFFAAAPSWPGSARPSTPSREQDTDGRHRADRDDLVRGTGYWALLGALAALGMLGKYTTALLLFALFAFAVLHPDVRRCWRGLGPWLALAVGALALLPHLLGLWQIDFTPLLFPFERAPGPSHWYDHIVNPLLFSAAQFGDVAAALLAIALLMWQRPGEAVAILRTRALPPDQRAYLATITWAPVGLAIATSLILGLHLKDMWGYPMWCFIGLFLVAELRGPFSREATRRLLVAVCVILIATPVVFAAQQSVGGGFVRKPLRSAFPGRELAAVVEQRWHAATGRPLGIVTGDVWLAGNIAFYGADRPSVFIDADPTKSPWITPQALAREGAVLIWFATEPAPAWLAQFPAARPQPPIELPYVPALGHEPARLAWAILWPAS